MTVKHFCSHQNLSEKDIQVIINDLKICEITCTLYLFFKEFTREIFLLLLEEMSLKFSVKKKLLHKYCYYFWTYQYIVFCQESLLFWQLYSLCVNCSFCENEKLVIRELCMHFFYTETLEEINWFAVFFSWIVKDVKKKFLFLIKKSCLVVLLMSETTLWKYPQFNFLSL